MAFKADPGKYAPQYGGYCAWAMREGKKADIDPEQWAIEDGKPYLNYNADIKTKWLKDKIHFIQLADGKWSALKKK